MQSDNPYMDWGILNLDSDNDYDDSQLSMPIMADHLGFSPLTLHYAYFVLIPAIASIIFYTASTQIHDLHYVDGLFMCFSAITGTGLNVMNLSILNSVQQGTLFTLLILGHAIPIFGFISLKRAWSLNSALKHSSNKETGEQNVPRTPTLQMQKEQITEDIILAPVTAKAKVTTAVREVPADVSSPGEPEGSWNDYGFMVVTDLTHRDQNQPVASITIIGNKKDVNNGKAKILRVNIRLKNMMQWAADRLARKDSIHFSAPGGVECMALFLISVLVILYFIGFLLLGIVSLGLWSKFVRPDIPRENGASPFWAGAFLATSALSNNGLSLIDTNMGPYQKE
ncbi:uncharacterized protein N7498_006322 [Penicillium cinerascens]|uniref:Uncharacterized protein n=1 Tax=Penicillium cinerascens TaxID=70096 RepID=A0A9W9MHW4_9EURO|nr:uncharacterized protein N7498_006322 [Penicillium cinerascens]KAJ5201659.1 hypothetical protein N7498_006322 [Penicillium cinerascens]